MTESRLSEYLNYMRRAGADACSFVEGLSKDEFLADKRTQQAVIMSLVIIGEAATKIMDQHAEFAASHPEVPWRTCAGCGTGSLGYFEINLDIVWETVQTALPEMLAKLPASNS